MAVSALGATDVGKADACTPPVALSCANLSKAYGGVHAVRDVSLVLHPAQIVGLVGANGAGKSTLLNLLTGVAQPDSGVIQVRGRPMNRQPPDAFAAAGVTRTFQKLRLFSSLSVADNVCVAMPSRDRWNLWNAIVRPRNEVVLERREKEQAVELLRRVGLEGKEHYDVGSLTYGQRRLVELARALARNAGILLLDEPAAGMNQAEEDQLREVVLRLKEDEKLSMFIVEHRWALLGASADRVVWLSHGEMASEGEPEAVFASILAAAEETST